MLYTRRSGVCSNNLIQLISFTFKSCLVVCEEVLRINGNSLTLEPKEGYKMARNQAKGAVAIANEEALSEAYEENKMDKSRRVF